MQSYSLTHVSDTVLLRELASLVARDRMNTAALLAHIAEVDARRLFVPAGYPSMHAYCVDELHLSEDAAFRRIRAARAAQQFPALLEALAEGRLHLAALSLLAPYLNEQNAADLIQAAAHRRKSEIEQDLARRFGPTETPSLVRPVLPVPTRQLVPGRVGSGSSDGRAPGMNDPSELVLGRVDEEGSSEEGGNPRVQEPDPERVVTDPEAERFLIQLTVGRAAYEKLRRAQDLLSHAVPSGDIAQVLERALDLLIAHVEKRKVGASPTPRSARASTRKRHVPALVRRAVWERDEGRCTFVSVDGKRCAARRLLEFDHIEPIARGGRATVAGIRLRCRAHNQYEAERLFGAGFMNEKRRQPPHVPAHAGTVPAPISTDEAQLRDVLAGLRNLGCPPGDARRAAEYSASLPVSTLEDRLRAAVQFLGGGHRAHRRSAPSG